MDFGLSDEQKLLEQTLRRLLADVAPPSRVREIMNGEAAHDPKLWAQLAELGVAGMLVPESQGGGGLALLDAAIAMQSLGHGATPAPFLATSVLAPVALAAGTPAQQRAWLPRIAAGDALLGVAATEVVNKRADAGMREAGGRLHGKALFVLDAGAADAFLVAIDCNQKCVGGTGVEDEERLAVNSSAFLSHACIGAPTCDFAGCDTEHCSPRRDARQPRALLLRRSRRERDRREHAGREERRRRRGMSERLHRDRSIE